MASNPSAIWRSRPGGNNANGGGFDTAITGAGTDYSQQNTSQAGGTNGAGTTGSAVFVDTTAAAFTSAMVGNAINIAGQGIYFIITFNNNSSIVLDRNLTTFTGASWRVGGGWADFTINATSGSTPISPVVPGNIIYILGGASPSFSTPDYNLSYFIPVRGDTTNGLIQWVGDPNTPSGNGYGGRPYILANFGALWYQSQWFAVRNLYCISGAYNAAGLIDPLATPAFITGVVFDQNGYDIGLTGVDGPCYVFNCEVFSSVPAHSTSAQAGIKLGPYGSKIVNCNIHDCINIGVNMDTIGTICGCIIAKNGQQGILFSGNTTSGWMTTVMNCTIDANVGHGMEISNVSGNYMALLGQTGIVGNIISNHTGSGKAGIAITTGTTTVNDRANGLIDYNSFYGNTTDHIGISAGVNDVVLSSDPYTDQAHEDYKLK